VRVLKVRYRRQLKHGRMLTFTQPREQHDRPARKFERVSMPVRAIAYIAEPGQALAELLFRKKAIAPSYLTSASNASSVPGGRHTEMSGSPTAAKPRVIELGKCVETSLSPTLVGTCCYVVETVVTHRRLSTCCEQPVWLSSGLQIVQLDKVLGGWPLIRGWAGSCLPPPTRISLRACPAS
jgi:hypothetical protein